MRLSQRRGALLKPPSQRVTGTFRTHSSLLRGGGGGLSVVFGHAQAWRYVEFELGLGFGGESPQGLALVRGGFGSLLFDNRIGRKRDVGGGVLAGLWLSGRLFKRKLRNSIRD
jgi:hypothetical protein